MYALLKAIFDDMGPKSVHSLVRSTSPRASRWVSNKHNAAGHKKKTKISKLIYII
jgi:hypothetical protein